jgi:hypothetical protein
MTDLHVESVCPGRVGEYIGKFITGCIEHNGNPEKYARTLAKQLRVE